MVFQRSEFDTRLTFSRMGAIDIAEGSEPREYVLESYPENLTDEFTKGDRPFFLRITNRGAQNLLHRSFGVPWQREHGIGEHFDPS